MERFICKLTSSDQFTKEGYSDVDISNSDVLDTHYGIIKEVRNSY